MINTQRVRILQEGNFGTGPVVYWMSRDQRCQDNWALLYAQQLALSRKTGLAVVFCVVDSFLGAGRRHYDFMAHGLREVAGDLQKKNIPFYLIYGSPAEALRRFLTQLKAGALITDFDPLRLKMAWKHALVARLHIPVWEVDAHNIVPCWLASPKQEYGAYTVRPKIHKRLAEFLTEFPDLKKHPYAAGKKPQNNWRKLETITAAVRSVAPVDWISPGERAARKNLQSFITKKLSRYAEQRNDPCADATSNLSPHLHFGHISAQRVAFEVQRATEKKETIAAFLEELIVRRELSDNFCYYNNQYDSVRGFPQWAQNTLRTHGKDRRQYRYSRDEFEQAATHDALWNAAQREMVKRGKMHGYMRMYWAKKILEWSVSVEEALRIAIYLNDTYELDGRDPNGYTGIAWSVGGVHDRAWSERDIFGKIRYMSYNGAKNKFDVEAYINKY